MDFVLIESIIFRVKSIIKFNLNSHFSNIRIFSYDSTMTQNYFEDYTSNKQVNWHIKPSLFQKKFFIERNLETAEMKNLIAIR